MDRIPPRHTLPMPSHPHITPPFRCPLSLPLSLLPCQVAPLPGALFFFSRFAGIVPRQGNSLRSPRRLVPLRFAHRSSLTHSLASLVCSLVPRRSCGASSLPPAGTHWPHRKNEASACRPEAARKLRRSDEEPARRAQRVPRQGNDTREAGEEKKSPRQGSNLPGATCQGQPARGQRKGATKGGEGGKGRVWGGKRKEWVE